MTNRHPNGPVGGYRRKCFFRQPSWVHLPSELGLCDSITFHSLLHHADAGKKSCRGLSPNARQNRVLTWGDSPRPLATVHDGPDGLWRTRSERPEHYACRAPSWLQRRRANPSSPLIDPASVAPVGRADRGADQGADRRADRRALFHTATPVGVNVQVTPQSEWAPPTADSVGIWW